MTTFRITFRALPGDVPPIIRLRMALKAFKRRYGLVATEAVERPDGDEEDPRRAAGRASQDR
jgi:hypothetical protein